MSDESSKCVHYNKNYTEFFLYNFTHHTCLTDAKRPICQHLEQPPNSNPEIQTHRSLKRMLIIMTKHNRQIFGVKTPFSSHEITLKQQLKGEK